MDQPLVSAVMVTGLPGRQWMAERAIDSFLAQTYPNKELIIINDGDYWVTDAYRGRDEELGVREYQIGSPKDSKLGDLRNMAMNFADGDWLIQWDDDDWYGPKRIEYQMKDHDQGLPTLLDWQVRYSAPNNSAFEFKWDGKIPGIPGSICFPKTDGLYRSESRHEDSHFIWDNFPNVIVLDNSPDNNPGPELYIRFYHGTNTWDHRHVMRRYSRPEYAGILDLSYSSDAALHKALSFKPWSTECSNST